MKSKIWTRIIALTLFAALAMPVSLAAQDRTQPQHQYHHYQIVDPGTFGGPQSWQFYPGVGRPGLLNNQGTLVGSADTLAVDSYCWWSPADCYATDAFQWRNGETTDLGVLPGGIGSQVNWISANGLMAGISDNGQPDPLNPALPQVHAVLWEHGQMTDLGTFAGGYDTWANAVNSRGEIAAQAYNKIPDANSLFGYGYQSRAFYWNNGVAQDLGTLGTGTDAVAGLINERGQVVGWSYTSSVPSTICAPTLPITTGSFLWDRKNGMKDIGGLGGTCTLANDLNDHGQIVGVASLTGDTQLHPFVWNAATGVTDLLNPSDSSYGEAVAENAHGDVAGGTCDSVTCYALLWRNSGGHWQKTSLSTSSQNAFSLSVNASEQVVGAWFGVGPFLEDAFLSENGSPIVDLNTLVPPGSGLQLVEADEINDRGEIVIDDAYDANGNHHALLLIPCDGHHPGVEGCDYSMVEASDVASRPSPAVTGAASRTSPQSLMRRMNRHHFPGLGASPRN